MGKKVGLLVFLLLFGMSISATAFNVKESYLFNDKNFTVHDGGEFFIEAQVQGKFVFFFEKDFVKTFVVERVDFDTLRTGRFLIQRIDFLIEREYERKVYDKDGVLIDEAIRSFPSIALDEKAYLEFYAPEDGYKYVFRFYP